MSTHDSPEPSLPERVYFLDRPANVKLVLRIFFALSGVLILLDLLPLIGLWPYKDHVHHAVEELPGFYAIYGLVGCVVLVLAAKVLRKIVMRGEDYYD